MDAKQKERLFGEIGIDLGYLTKEDVQKALDKQAADETAGSRKAIGTYLVEMTLLTEEKVTEILEIQSMTVRMTPHIINE